MANQGGADGAAPRLPGARPRSITLYLFVLALVALLPAFVVSAVLLARNSEAQQRVLLSLTSATTEAISGAVERQLDGLATTLRVLSTSRFLGTDLSEFHERATRALAGTGAYLIVLDESLQQLLNTRVPFGTELSRTSDPASAERALATGRTVISDVFFGQTAQQWVFNIVMPLAEPGPPGSPRAMILTQNAGALAEPATSRELPDYWNLAIIDASGGAIASYGGDALAVGDPMVLPIDRSPGMRGQWQSVAINGIRQSALTANVSSSGWQVVVWAAESDVQKPLMEALWSLIVGGVLLAALVVLVIYWVSLQIGRSVRGLEDDARRLGAGEPVTSRRYPISEVSTVSEALADASTRRQAAETEVRLLMRELAHRSKNQMAVIAAMAKQSAKGADSVPEFVASFERRIYGLARSTDLLLAHGIAGVDLRDVIARQVDPLCPLDSGRVDIEGPSIKVNVPSAQILGMAAHELATNAVRYGAFATETGRIDINWRIDDGRLHFVWREYADRPAAAPRRRGFGTVVLETMVGRSLGAEVRNIRHPDGIEWSVDIPLESLDVHKPRDEGTAPDATSPPPVASTGAEK